MKKDPLSLQAVAYGIRVLKSVYQNKAWQTDALSTLLAALEERSEPVRSGEVLRALEYQQLVLILMLYLKSRPDFINKRDMLIICVCKDLLKLTENRPNPDTGDYERVSDILCSCIHSLREKPRA